MTTFTDTTFDIKSDATEWLVMIRPGTREFRSPTKKRVFKLQAGVDYVVIFYGYGDPGNSIELKTTANNVVKITHSETVPPGAKFAVGHNHMVL